MYIYNQVRRDVKKKKTIRLARVKIKLCTTGVVQLLEQCHQGTEYPVKLLIASSSLKAAANDDSQIASLLGKRERQLARPINVAQKFISRYEN